jgi:hypothetical protein
MTRVLLRTNPLGSGDERVTLVSRERAVERDDAVTKMVDALAHRRSGGLSPSPELTPNATRATTLAYGL